MVMGRRAERLAEEIREQVARMSASDLFPRRSSSRWGLDDPAHHEGGSILVTTGAAACAGAPRAGDETRRIVAMMSSVPATIHPAATRCFANGPTATRR